MSACFYVYVGTASTRNYERGKEQCVWGWESSVLDRGNPGGPTNRDVALRIRLGDYLILGFGVPGGPRVREETFIEQTLSEVIITQVLRPLYNSTTEVWTDKVYPERVDLQLLQLFTEVPGRRFGAAAMNALRLSGTKQGAPIAGEPPFFGTIATATEPRVDDELNLVGDLDALIFALRRREQRRLRARKFGSMTEAACDICGRTLPVRLLVVAHVKRRADATRNERLDPHNVMAACLLGCDALFEYGYIYIDSTGTVQVNEVAIEPMPHELERLQGRRCTAHSPRSSSFFAAHALRSMGARADAAWPQVGWDVPPTPSDKGQKTSSSGRTSARHA